MADKVDYKDISGISVKFEKKEYPKFPEKEWVLVEITGGKIIPSKNKGWADSIAWSLSVHHPGFENRKTTYFTPAVLSDGNKLHLFYNEVMGKNEMVEGKEYKLDEFIGKKCYIMFVPSTKDKTKQFVSDVKHYGDKSPAVNTVEEEHEEVEQEDEIDFGGL